MPPILTSSSSFFSTAEPTTLELSSFIADSTTNTASALSSVLSDDWKGLFTPKNPAAWRMYWSAGLALSILPRSVVYDEVTRQIPQLNLNWRMGLPANFGVEAHINTVYLTNLARLGFSWSHNFGAVSVSVGDDFGVWFGFASLLSDFNVKALGILNFPKINVGININNYLLSVQGELITSLGSTTWLGPQETPIRGKSERLGSALTITAEQNISEHIRCYVGLKTYYTLPRYQMWLAFSDISYRVVIPEIFFGYIF